MGCCKHLQVISGVPRTGPGCTIVSRRGKTLLMMSDARYTSLEVDVGCLLPTFTFGGRVFCHLAALLEEGFCRALRIRCRENQSLGSSFAPHQSQLECRLPAWHRRRCPPCFELRLPARLHCLLPGRSRPLPICARRTVPR